MVLGRLSWSGAACARALATLLVTVLLVTGQPVHAAEPVPTVPTLESPPGYAGEEVPLSVGLVTADGTPVAGAEVHVERLTDGAWAEVAVVVTDEAGRAEVFQVLAQDRDDNGFRARYDGDTTYAASTGDRYDAPLLRRASRVTVGGPREVVDEESVALRVRWRAAGQPVAGRVRLQRRLPGRDWRTFRRPRTGEDGLVAVTVRPRTDTRWRVRAPRLDWVRADRSGVHRVDNLPPGTPVRLPSGAPRPRVKLPDQARALGEGANPRTTAVPGWMWNQMTGRSWHRGCPVGRSGLRLLRINYWAYDGYRHRGEVVARTDAIDNIRGALTEMHRRGLPLRSLYRVDRFGWSRRLQGADDYRSMAAGNSSAFNCRDVVGRPGVRSPHSTGRSFDVNPWENPYRSSHGWTPNGWWPGRSHPRVAWRSRQHPVVGIMLAHGFRWTYGTGDSHHFDVPAPSGRVARARADGCAEEVCH